MSAINLILTLLPILSKTEVKENLAANKMQ